MIRREEKYRRIKRVSGWPELVVSRDMFYLMENDDGKDVGVWVFHPCEDGLMVHVAMDNSHRGAYAAASVRDAFAWIFLHTKHTTLVAEIPDAMRHVQFMARHVGMLLDGIDAHGLRCYRLNKPDIQRRAA